MKTLLLLAKGFETMEFSVFVDVKHIKLHLQSIHMNADYLIE